LRRTDRGTDVELPTLQPAIPIHWRRVALDEEVPRLLTSVGAAAKDLGPKSPFCRSIPSWNSAGEPPGSTAIVDPVAALDVELPSVILANG
jgi:hypothetical protein